MAFDIAATFSHSELRFNRNVRYQRDDFVKEVTHPANMNASKVFGANLKAARLGRGWSQDKLVEEAGVGSKGYISALESGTRPIPPGSTLEKLSAALQVPIDQLVGPGADVPQLVRVAGRVGANPDDSIIYTAADDAGAWAPLPPGGTTRSAAVEVVGHSMRWVAEDGSLIYFEQQRNPPSEDMLGDIVIVETEDGQVLVKRLLRGSKAKLYDLESSNGPTLRDKRLVWAAEITAIVPPKQARRIIKRGEAA